MILPIVSFGASILREKCKNINSDYPDLDILLDNMWETMYNANGVGLAAPQINKNIRLFLIDTSPFLEDDHTKEPPVKKVFINAKIVKEEGDEWSFNEGCLSIPEIREDVVRKPTIVVEYLNDKFERKIETFNGITARVIQHEYDHINGILFTDKLSPLRKRMIKSKLFEISKGNIQVPYKMRFSK
tara:strand:- start:44378 stop:44935 length:558 start_codon:yes stop_codon:yes gene_type:complete